MSTHPWDTLPPAFIERVSRLIPAPQLSAVIESFCRKRPTTLRVNTLKSDNGRVEAELSRLGLEYKKVSWYDQAYILSGDPFITLGTLMESEMYQQGAIYVQNLSSMIPPLILNPQPGERVLDIAAAPGSKTTQMAMMMENKGEILANDLSPIRLFKLKANLERQGVKNAQPYKMPGQFLWKRYANYFDRALVDAPCSLEGTIMAGQPKSYAQWSVHKIRDLSQRQRYLVRSAISTTRVGGEIVYSTCTLAPEENEGVVDWILDKERDRIEILPIELAGVETTPAVLQFGNAKAYDERVSLSMRILPSAIMEGFFVARLRRVA